MARSLAGFGWLSLTRISNGFGLISAGSGSNSVGFGLAWAWFGLDLALSLAFITIVACSSLS